MRDEPLRGQVQTNLMASSRHSAAKSAFFILTAATCLGNKRAPGVSGVAPPTARLRGCSRTAAQLQESYPPLIQI